ncbi:12511_t:CDS:2, partial [Ambispora gerdemannii]
MALKQQTQTSSNKIENNNNNIRIKSNLRECNTNEIDTTGKRFLFQVRGASYPPIRRTRSNLKNSTNCKSCNQNCQYIDSLEARLSDLYLTVDKFSRVKVITNSFEKEKYDFSNMPYGVDIVTASDQTSPTTTFWREKRQRRSPTPMNKELNNCFSAIDNRLLPDLEIDCHELHAYKYPDIDTLDFVSLEFVSLEFVSL